MKNFDFLNGAVDAKLALSAIKDEMAEFDRMTNSQASLPPILEKQKLAIQKRFETLLKDYMDIE